MHTRPRSFKQVKQNLKGHHLRGALPPLPEKPLKQLTDHRCVLFMFFCLCAFRHTYAPMNYIRLTLHFFILTFSLLDRLLNSPPCRDPTFVQERCSKLELYLSSLVAVPHVGDMVCVKAFLGVMEQVLSPCLALPCPALPCSTLLCPPLLYSALSWSGLAVTRY